MIESLYLHVQVGNDEARAFWEKHGFVVTVSNSVVARVGVRVVLSARGADGGSLGLWRAGDGVELLPQDHGESHGPSLSVTCASRVRGNQAC